MVILEEKGLLGIGVFLYLKFSSSSTTRTKTFELHQQQNVSLLKNKPKNPILTTFNSPATSARRVSCRYDSYDPYDSRSPMNDRNMYRSGYDYDYTESEHDNDNAYEGPYDNFYGNRREQYHNRYNRDNFAQRGQNWGRDGRNNRSGSSPYGGRAGGQWDEPPPAVASRGFGSNRLPSLFSHNIIPELNMFQGMRGFSGNMRYGGGMMKQRMRRNWRMWDSDFRVSICAVSLESRGYFLTDGLQNTPRGSEKLCSGFSPVLGHGATLIQDCVPTSEPGKHLFPPNSSLRALDGASLDGAFDPGDV